MIGADASLAKAICRDGKTAPFGAASPNVGSAKNRLKFVGATTSIEPYVVREKKIMTLRKRLIATVAAVLLMATSAVTVVADTTDSTTGTITVTANDGGLSTSISSVTFDPVTFSLAAQNITGEVVLNAIDSRGTNGAWWVQFAITSNFNPSDSSHPSIPLSAFSGTGATFANLAGMNVNNQAFGLTDGKWTAPADNTGSYNATVNGSVAIPAGLPVDTYTATLTVEIHAGTP